MIAGTQQTVFVQLHQHTKGKSAVAPPVPPETFGAYANKGQKSNSVMALMDMLTKDLEKDMQEAEHNEKTAQKEYEQLLADAQETRAQDVKTITTNENSKAELEGELDQAKTQQIMAKDQKKQLESYLADLHSSCDFVVANFDVRKSARSTEIDSLANAKAVLNGASYQ
jgi:arginine utilization protein RocB